MKLQLKEIGLFVILPILLMSFALSSIGTHDSFTVHHEIESVNSVNLTPNVNDSCDVSPCPDALHKIWFYAILGTIYFLFGDNDMTSVTHALFLIFQTTMWFNLCSFSDIIFASMSNSPVVLEMSLTSEISYSWSMTEFFISSSHFIKTYSEGN